LTSLLTRQSGILSLRSLNELIESALAWELIEVFLAARFSGAPRHGRRPAEVQPLELASAH
jgi:hypothetical protein